MSSEQIGVMQPCRKEAVSSRGLGLIFGVSKTSFPGFLSEVRHFFKIGMEWRDAPEAWAVILEGRGRCAARAQFRRYKNRIRIRKPTTYPTYAFRRP